MRLTVCVPEIDVMKWFEARDVVLRVLAQHLDDRDHATVRTGSFVEYSRFREDWTGDRSDPVRSTADRSDVHLGLFHIGGLPPAKLEPVRSSLAIEVPNTYGTTVVSHEERRTLIHFEHTLPLRYRVVGNQVRVLHEMRELQEDLAEPEYQASLLRDLGCFSDVALEDIGLQDTVFDEVNFGRAFVRRIELASCVPDPWQSEAVCTWLVTIDPRLNDTLHAAVERAATAATTEQVAQAALSCRRYLEQLANALFPPRSELFNGRKVGTAEWKNRLWAALELRIGASTQPDELNRLGKWLDDIKNRTDVGVHHNPGVSQSELEAMIADLLSFSDEVRGLQPPELKAPLGPYSPAVVRFAESFREGHKG